MTATWIEHYPRETVEFIPIVDVTIDGEPTNTFQVTITRSYERPITWAAATVVDGVPGVMIDGLSPGKHKVWVRFSDAPETPVLEVGEFRIT